MLTTTHTLRAYINCLLLFTLLISGFYHVTLNTVTLANCFSQIRGDVHRKICLNCLELYWFFSDLLRRLTAH